MGWRGIALQLLGLPMVWFAMLWMQRDELIYHPSAYAQPVDTSSLPRGLDLEELRFETEDGNQTAFLLRNRRSEVRRVYLVFGGNAMLALDWLDVLAPVVDGSMGDVAFVLVDYPGYGDSAGHPSQASIVRAGNGAMAAANEALFGGVMDEVVDYGALGHSIGCAAALHVAAGLRGSHMALRHVVLSAPFTSIAELARDMMPPLRALPLWLLSFVLYGNRWDNRAAAELLAGASSPPKIDVIHGSQDKMIDEAHGRGLTARFKALGLSTAFASAKAGHNDLLVTRRYRRWLRSALEQSDRTNA